MLDLLNVINAENGSSYFDSYTWKIRQKGFIEIHLLSSPL